MKRVGMAVSIQEYIDDIARKLECGGVWFLMTEVDHQQIKWQDEDETKVSMQDFWL